MSDLVAVMEERFLSSPVENVAIINREEWLTLKAELAQQTINTGSPKFSPVQQLKAKMPSYGESVNAVVAETGMGELTYRERKLTLAIHDYIARHIGC